MCMVNKITSWYWNIWLINTTVKVVIGTLFTNKVYKLIIPNMYFFRVEKIGTICFYPIPWNNTLEAEKKWSPFTWYFQTYFREWKYVNIDSYFTEVFSLGSILKYSSRMTSVHSLVRQVTWMTGAKGKILVLSHKTLTGTKAMPLSVLTPGYHSENGLLAHNWNLKRVPFCYKYYCLHIIGSQLDTSQLEFVSGAELQNAKNKTSLLIPPLDHEGKDMTFIDSVYKTIRPSEIPSSKFLCSHISK